VVSALPKSVCTARLVDGHSVRVVQSADTVAPNRSPALEKRQTSRVEQTVPLAHQRVVDRGNDGNQFESVADGNADAEFGSQAGVVRRGARDVDAVRAE
jgi:hypothetical protein